MLAVKAPVIGQAHYVIYIVLEGHIYQRVHRLDFASDLQEANVFDLMSRRNTIDELAKVSALSLDILYYSRKRIPSETTLKVLEKRTSAQEPLVVRFTLSSNTSRIFFFFLACVCQYLSHFRSYIVVANFGFLGVTGNSYPPHHWRLAHASCRDQSEV